MTAPSQTPPRSPDGPRAPSASDALARPRRPWIRHPRALARESAALSGLCSLAVLVVVLVLAAPTVMSFSALSIPLLLGSLVLGPRHLPWFVVFILVLLFVSLLAQTEITYRIANAAIVQLVLCLIVLLTSFRRSRLGVAGVLGESMFVDLRDRILNQGGEPVLPSGWRTDWALRSAGGTLFAGDFVVSTQPEPGRLEVVVVDVSGKGEQAGTRALLLSGAFGGLLGALPASRFLPAANDYLLRQDWAEGFATAVHLSLDLVTGGYEIRTAGHPPAAHRDAGTGRWHVLGSEGPVLGLLDDALFVAETGVLGHGDTLLLYTDGMVEQPRRDIELGIDELLGGAEVMLQNDLVGAAGRLVDELGSRDDDRAVLVVNRT